MARRNMQDLLRSVKEATALGAEHRKIVESLGVAPSSATKSDLQVRPDGPTSKSDFQVQVGLAGPTSRSMQSDLEVQPSGPTFKSDSTVGLDALEPNLVKGRERPLTKNQQRVFDYLLRQGPHVTDKRIVAEATGLSQFTVKTILARLASLGMLERSRVGQGTRLLARYPGSESKQGPTCKSDLQVQPSGPTFQSDLSPSKKIDRLKTLSISQERVDLTWPHLARHGFGSSQIDQIAQALAELGMTTDRVVQGLHHAEWELEHGKMLDKNGVPVADPCSWVFRSLARTGYYRRPAGYVSPEEQALRDADEEAKAVSLARQKAEISRFEAWRDSLSPDALEEAMKKYQAGPKDVWLRKYWREYVKRD